MTPAEEHEARIRGQAIADLQGHWGEAYEIGWGGGMYVAIRRDDGATVRRVTARELHDEMARDHAVQPARRDLPVMQPDDRI